MRNLSLALTSYLAGSLIAITNCVKITRLDGEQFGFTALDQDITFDGVTYEAMTSVDMSELRTEAGSGVDNADLIGLITSDRITETDILAGLWDGARIEMFFLPFENTDLGRIGPLVSGTLGELRLQAGQYQAEVRSLSQRLAQQIVEVAAPTCSVRELFDARCMPKGHNEGTNTGTLTPDDFRNTRTVATVTSSHVLRFSDDAAPNHWYRYGKVTFLTGANAGIAREVKSHASGSPTMLDPLTLSNLQLHLWSEDVTGTHGASASTLPDRSPHGRHATQATGARQPLINDGASPAGVRMLLFDGVDDLMQGPLPGAPGINISAGLTVYVYCEEQALTTPVWNTQELFYCGNSVSIFELVTRTSSSLGVGWPDQQYGVNSGNARAAHGATQLGFQTLTLVFEPPAGATANWRLYRDQTQQGAAGVNWQATAIRNDYGVGNSPGANVGFKGLVGSVTLFSEAHGLATRQGVRAFLLDAFTGSPGNEAVITLQEPFPFAVQPGDTAELEAGCDRLFSTCVGKYKNWVNFAGFPHLPGNENLIRKPRQ